MKIEIHKGIVIQHDPKTSEYYTEVVIRKKPAKGNQYTSSPTIAKVRLEIDKFLKSLKKKATQKVWIRGAYQDGRYKLVEIIFQDKASKIITVRDKGGKISSVSLSDYKFDEDKVFIDSPYNRKTIGLMESKQCLLETLRTERADLKTTLFPFKSRLLR